MPALPVEGAVRLVAGGPNALARLGEAIRLADGPVLGEIYQATRLGVIDELVGAAARGRQVHALLNPASFADDAGTAIADLISSSGAKVARYTSPGDDLLGGAATAASSTPLWQHAKTWYLGGSAPEAWVTNLALIPESAIRSELAVVVRGRAAEAVRELTETALSRNPVAMRQAADDAARAGVLVNDPASGAFHLTAELGRLIDDAADDLLVVTKALDAPEWSQRIAAAARRGVRVDVHVRDIAQADADILAAASVPVTVLRNATPRWRANVVVADDRAYVGSAFFWPQMVGSTGGSTRDIGVLLAGTGARDARTAVLDILASTRGAMSLDAARAARLLGIPA